MARKDPVILERRFVPGGQTIIRQGDTGYTAFLIQSGEVEVFSENKDRETTLSKLESGEIFGETALIFDKPRTASVRAVKDTTVIVISRQDLQAKLDQADPTIRAIVRMLSNRMIETNNALLNKKDNPDDLRNVVLALYDRIIETLPASKKGRFRTMVHPELNSLIEAINEFEEDYGRD